jgi:hypothetical protein
MVWDGANGRQIANMPLRSRWIVSSSWAPNMQHVYI